MRVTAQDIEIAVAVFFGYRANIIVPNVSYGMGLHYEADLVVLRPSGWAIEVEIKVSSADISADLNKRRQHDSDLFKELYFAVPEALAGNSNIPARAGIISVAPNRYGELCARKVRDAARRRSARAWDATKRERLLRLAAMRTWSLKQHLAAERRK